MKVSHAFINILGYFFLIFCGLASGAIFILEHGLSETWLALQEREFRLVLGIAFVVAGIFGILLETIPRMISGRKRDSLRKKYAERYK